MIILGIIQLEEKLLENASLAVYEVIGQAIQKQDWAQAFSVYLSDLYKALEPKYPNILQKLASIFAWGIAKSQVEFNDLTIEFF